jgi:hypothetical protein
MTRLSCHRFRSNEVRLWLSVMAYNLGNLWRRLVFAAFFVPGGRRSRPLPGHRSRSRWKKFKKPAPAEVVGCIVI